MSLAGRIRGAE